MSSYETSELSCVLYDKACCLLGMLGISGTMTLPIIIVPLCSHIVVPLLFSMRRGWVCSDSPDGLWLPSAHYNFLVASVVGLSVFSVLPHRFGTVTRTIIIGESYFYIRQLLYLT